jgi:signal transduction histidine kinase
MNLFFLFSLINGITATILGIFVYYKNRKSLINKTFFLMSLGVAIWSFSYCKWLLINEEGAALFWSRMLNFGATLIPIFYLHWVLSFLNLAKKKKKLLIAGYLITSIFLISSFTPYYITSVKPILSFPYWPQAGFLYVCFLFFGYLGLISYGIYQLFKMRKVATKEGQAQIDYIILGSLLGFGGGATNFPLMFGVSLLPPVGQPLIMLYVLILAFAITKYHLFEIRVILTEFLVGLASLILLIQALAAETLLLKILGFGLLALFIYLGYELIKSVLREIQQRQEIEKIDKAKSEFISIASHQLRTPLAAVKGYISMILEGTYGQLSEKLSKPLKNVFQSNERLIRLVNDLLNLSRLDAGKIEFSPKLTSLEKMVSDIVEELRINAEKKGLYIKMVKPSKSLPKIMVDQDKLRQVILNIVDNAIKYTKEGGITFELKKLDEQEEIKVADTGEGMDKRELNGLFQMFSRATAGTQLHTEGAGLGLYVAKQFIEMHGGKIWAESPGKGKGSTFIIQLPIKLDLKLAKEKNKGSNFYIELPIK